MLVEELNIRQEKFFRERRHSFLDPLDVRDFLEPDKYHRYEGIMRYLKVRIIIFLSALSSQFSVSKLLKISRIFPPDIPSWSF